MKKLFLILLMLMTFSHVKAQEDMLQENEYLEPPPESAPADNQTAPDMAPSDNNAGSEGNPAFNPSNTPNLGKSNPAFESAKKRSRKVPPLSQASDADMTNENYPDVIESFDFPNADIADVIKAISELTGKNFIVDPSVSGKITIMAPTQITVAEAYKVFLSALAIRGYAVVPSGKFYKILPVRDAQRDNIEIYSGAYTPDTDQMITRIIHLRYVPASEMNKFTSKLVSKNGNIDIYEPTNSLIVSDQASSVQRIMKIVAQLDIASFDEQLAVIPIRYARAKDIADLIQQIINKGNKSTTSTFGGGIPRFRTGANQPSGSSAYSTVIPDERTNSVIVVGNKDGIDKIRKLVATLDTQHAIQSGAYVYYVKYGDAEKIADILNGIAKSLKEEAKDTKGQQNVPPPPAFDAFGNPFAGTTATQTASQSTGLFGADVKISAAKDTNSLVIVGSKQDYQAVLALLRKIDIPRDQVYVETVIMEMNANDVNDFGISYYKFDKDSKGLARVGFGGGNISTLANVTSKGAILGFGSGDTVTINVGGKDISVKSLMGFLNLLKQNTRSNVLATPQVIAMDNQKATVEVGENVPVGLNTTASTTGTTQSVDRVDATIKLEIKPFISPSSESVRMEIKQTIKQVGNAIADTAGGTQLAGISRSVINRALETNIVVKDGDTAVLGGLMRDSEKVDVSKVPLLGDIPVIGWFFKSQKTSLEKVNLLIFITPRVIRNPEDNNMLTARKLDERLRYIKEVEGGVDKFGATAENLRPKEKKAPKKDDKSNDDEFIEEE